MLARLSVAAAAAATLALTGCSDPVTERLEWESMGTTAEAVVVTRGAADAAELLSEIRRRTSDAELELDPYAADGALGRLNLEASDRFHTVEKIDLFTCLRLALDYAKQSEGAYDPTAGALVQLYRTRIESGNLPRAAEIEAALGRVGWEKVTVEPKAFAFRFRAPGLVLDLGPVAHGCAVDWAARTFARAGTLGGMIRVNGAVRAWQSPPDRDEWAVALPDPRAPGRELGRVDAANRAVAVCGQPVVVEQSVQAELRRQPVIDPRTGQPATSDLLAVVTTADSAADAAALCQAIYVSGSLSGTDLFREMRRAEAVLLIRGDAGPPYVVASASLRGRLGLSAELAGEVGDDVRYLLPPEDL